MLGDRSREYHVTSMQVRIYPLGLIPHHLQLLSFFSFLGLIYYDTKEATHPKPGVRPGKLPSLCACTGNPRNPIAIIESYQQ